MVSSALHLNENIPARLHQTPPRTRLSALQCLLTIYHCHSGPFGPSTPALTHEIVEARHPPIQSSHYFDCAFTHRHHHCAAADLRHPTRSRRNGNFLRARTWGARIHARAIRMQCEHEKILLHDLQTYTKRITLVNVNLSLFSSLCECIYCMINATTLFVCYLFQIYMHISNIHILNTHIN